MNILDISGKWKGEFSEVFEGHAKMESQPFEMELTIVNNRSYVGMFNIAFEGNCVITTRENDLTAQATVYGSTDLHEITFIKQYSKLMIYSERGKVETHDQPHPEIYYSGKFSSNSFFGNWRLNSTYRKVNGNVLQLRPMEGLWWMKKI